MREVIFALQGLNGRIIRQDADGRFTITKSHIGMIDPTQRMLLEKLTNFGWLVNKIKNHINMVNRDPTQGKVSQCLAAALNNELLEYYQMVTEIEHYNCVEKRGGKLSGNHESMAPPVTLHQIHVWSLDHYFRLKTLAMLVECCKTERGGHLARIVYRFMQQGDKQIRAIITRILSQIVLPIRQMLSQWIFHGEIQDPFDEFFICLDDHSHEGLTSSVTMMSLTSTPAHNHTFNSNHTNQCQQTIDNIPRIPHYMQTHRNHPLPISSSLSSLSSASIDEKQYIINDYMMPGFISRQQANKILATGKAVHLLRKVCAESIASSVPGYDDLKKSFESTNIESLFRSQRLLNSGEENEFEHLLNTAYKEVSQKALELLFGNYKLRSHFRGLRQYLLLGQGDFIRHLMDLLKTELDKPALECGFRNIESVLECAMHSTNAKFDEPDVIKRLDCRLLDPPSPQASGWDIFSLVYKVDGPINSIFTEEKIRDYIEIFRQLWRTKRVEHVLTSLWSEQMFYSKRSSELPSIGPVFHRANILLTEMIHFMQHFQNYIMFEVVECSWVELVAATDVAKDVDDVIAAHDSYLRKIKRGIMCQKDILFDCIIDFQQLTTSLWRDFDEKLKLLPEADMKRNLNNYENKIQTLAAKFQKHRLIRFET